MDLGIDASSLKEVGASKRIVLTRKLITSGPNRFESCSNYIDERPSPRESNTLTS